MCGTDCCVVLVEGRETKRDVGQAGSNPVLAISVWSAWSLGETGPRGVSRGVFEVCLLGIAEWKMIDGQAVYAYKTTRRCWTWSVAAGSCGC